MLGWIDKGAMSGYNRHGTAGYSLADHILSGHVDIWLIGGDQARNPSRPGPEQRAPWAKHVRPGRNDYDRSTPVGPTDETSRERLGQTTRRSDQA